MLAKTFCSACLIQHAVETYLWIAPETRVQSSTLN